MTNLLLNGTFAAGITNWNLTTPTATINATGGIGGTQCAQYTQNNRRIQQNFTVVVGQQYDLLFWLNFQNAGMVVEVQVRDNVNSALYVNQSIPSNNIGTYVLYTITFTSTGNPSCNVRIRRDSGGGATNVFVDNVGIYPFGLCYDASSLVLSREIQSGLVEERPASEINSEHEVYDVQKRAFVPVVMNVISGPVIQYSRLPIGSYGQDEGWNSVDHPELGDWSADSRPVPSRDYLITRGHKVMYQGTPTKVRDLPHKKRTRVKPCPVYSIVCPENSVILVNNFPTLTFSQTEMEAILRHNRLCTTEPYKGEDGSSSSDERTTEPLEGEDGSSSDE